MAGGQDYGAARGTLLFWRVADGALMRAYVGQTSTAVLSVQYSPDGNLYAYARADGGVVVARNPFATAPLLISEFRTSGPAGAQDEFIEL